HDLTVHAPTQMPRMSRGRAAAMVHLADDTVRLIAPNVGGSFGSKHWAPEYMVAIAVARTLQRPVKWAETRSENMVAMPHGRGQVHLVELGLSRDGTFEALRAKVIGDAGAYPGIAAFLVFLTRMMAQGVYAFPKLEVNGVSAVTNTTPMAAYRGAGRPEATALLERIVDMAAAELDLDPIEIRKKNFIPPDAFPLTTLTGANYDVGDY